MLKIGRSVWSAMLLVGFMELCGVGERPAYALAPAALPLAEWQIQIDESAEKVVADVAELLGATASHKIAATKKSAGEYWFVVPEDLPLLANFFSSETLSLKVKEFLDKERLTEQVSADGLLAAMVAAKWMAKDTDNNGFYHLCDDILEKSLWDEPHDACLNKAAEEKLKNMMMKAFLVTRAIDERHYKQEIKLDVPEHHRVVAMSPEGINTFKEKALTYRAVTDFRHRYYVPNFLLKLRLALLQEDKEGQKTLLQQYVKHNFRVTADAPYKNFYKSSGHVGLHDGVLDRQTNEDITIRFGLGLVCSVSPNGKVTVDTVLGDRVNMTFSALAALSQSTLATDVDRANLSLWGISDDVQEENDSSILNWAEMSFEDVLGTPLKEQPSLEKPLCPLYQILDQALKTREMCDQLKNMMGAENFSMSESGIVFYVQDGQWVDPLAVDVTANDRYSLEFKALSFQGQKLFFVRWDQLDDIFHKYADELFYTLQFVKSSRLLLGDSMRLVQEADVLLTVVLSWKELQDFLPLLKDVINSKKGDFPVDFFDGKTRMLGKAEAERLKKVRKGKKIDFLFHHWLKDKIPSNKKRILTFDISSFVSENDFDEVGNLARSA